MNKKQTINIVIAILAICLSFYAGTLYSAKGKMATNQQNRQMGNTKQFNPNGGMITGEIVSKDDQSISVKIRDEGSKIVFFSTSTLISKGVQGSINDLVSGSQVAIFGTQNKDGSITAKTIQLRGGLEDKNFMPAPPK